MIHVEGLATTAGVFRLENVSFELAAGEYAALMGRTGSGKTTLLECLCGLRPIEAGRIVLAGRDVTGRRPAERGIGYVPQDGVLFPRMTVRAHLEFPLTIRRWPNDKIRRRVDELAAMLSIRPLLDRRPARLSGGEVQRVALGRALAFMPQVLLLDEPLSALDDQTRGAMYDVLHAMQAQSGVTTLHVTHNREEAERLADRTLYLCDGRIAEADPSQRAVNAIP